MPALRERYDPILMIDVLEYFSFEEGVRLLRGRLERGRSLVVSPLDIGRQAEHFGNLRETWERSTAFNGKNVK